MHPPKFCLSIREDAETPSFGFPGSSDQSEEDAVVTPFDFSNKKMEYIEFLTVTIELLCVQRMTEVLPSLAHLSEIPSNVNIPQPPYLKISFDLAEC